MLNAECFLDERNLSDIILINYSITQYYNLCINFSYILPPLLLSRNKDKIVPYCSWGGCIVVIVDQNKVSQFVEDLRAYLCRNNTKDRAELEDMVFPTSPNQGAVIYTVSTPF